MKFSRSLLVVIVILVVMIYGCDIIKPGSKDKSIKPNVLQSEKANHMIAEDLLALDDGFLLLGEGTTRFEKPDQMYLAKLDREGDIIWERLYEDEKNRGPKEIIKTSDGNLLVTGLVSSDVTMHGDLYAGKLTPGGNIIWEDGYLFKYDDAKFGGNTGFAAAEVDDGYLLGGEGMSSARSSGVTTTMITKVNFEGVKQWSEMLDKQSRVDWVYDLLYDAEIGDVFAAGDFTDEYDIVRFNPSNQTSKKVWSEQVTFDGHPEFYDMIQTDPGSYVAVGEQDGFLMQAAFDSEGNRLWHNTLTDYEFQAANEIMKSSNDNFYTLGRATDSVSSKSDIYVIGSNADGTIKWKQTYGQPDNHEVPVDFVQLNSKSLGVVTNHQHGGIYDIQFWRIPINDTD